MRRVIFAVAALTLCQTGHLYAADNPFLNATPASLKSDEANDPAGIYNLGRKYQFGTGVPKDVPKARKLYQQSAEAGNVAAMNDYGWLLLNGIGGPKDAASARTWFEKSAAGGNTRAMVNMGWLAEGNNGSGSRAEARRWYEKAAALGDQTAKENLAILNAPPRRAQPQRRNNYSEGSGDSGNIVILPSSSTRPAGNCLPMAGGMWSCTR